MKSKYQSELISFLVFLTFSVSSCKNSKDNSAVNSSVDSVEVNNEIAAQPAEKETLPQNTYVKVFKSTEQGDNGFGYDIYVNDKLYIHQPHIPAVAGNNSFASESDAKKAGEFVSEKIKKNIMPPGITISELDSLGIR
ncbi:MAG: DUF4907 domain-containing protein [Bacteroidota bacterium]